MSLEGKGNTSNWPRKGHEILWLFGLTMTSFTEELTQNCRDRVYRGTPISWQWWPYEPRYPYLCTSVSLTSVNLASGQRWVDCESPQVSVGTIQSSAVSNEIRKVPMLMSPTTRRYFFWLRTRVQTHSGEERGAGMLPQEWVGGRNQGPQNLQPLSKTASKTDHIESTPMGSNLSASKPSTRGF